jgi:UPF0716 protein FxsA
VVFFVALVVLCIAELYVFVQVANWIGFLWALVGLVAVSIVGLVVVKRQGLGVMRRLAADEQDRQPPSKALADGAMIFSAGVLLFFPGYLTGLMGLLLLLPPVRAALRPTLTRSVRRRGRVITATYTTIRRDQPGNDGGVIDTTGNEQGQPRGELGPS